jgi:hypothetical protein
MRALPRRSSASAVLAAAAIALTGCGGGDNGGTTNSAKPAVADAAFRAKMKPICAKAATRSAKALGAKSIKDFERYGLEAGAAVKAFRAELASIESPAQLADGWQRWLAAIDEDIATYNLARLAGSVNNQAATLKQTSKLSPAKPGKAARALGIPECAEPTDRAAHTFSAGPGS